jgi:hypothetical protein
MLCLAFPPPLPLGAQATGSADGARRGADLRYVADSTASFVYAGEERSEPGGPRPAGNVVIRSVVELLLLPAETGISARVVTRERTSSTGRARPRPPEQLLISSRGEPLDGGDADQYHPIMGDGPLLLLPGRELRPGESWADTVKLSLEQDGMAMVVEARIRGTYERDTMVAGRTLNVLRYASDDVATGSGEIMGARVEVTAHSRREGIVLWDSARHAAVESEMRRITEIGSPAVQRTGTDTITWRLLE